MTRSARFGFTLQEELAIVHADEIADDVEFEADKDFEWSSHVFGDFDDLYGDDVYDYWNDDDYENCMDEL